MIRGILIHYSANERKIFSGWPSITLKYKIYRHLQSQTNDELKKLDWKEEYYYFQGVKLLACLLYLV